MVTVVMTTYNPTPDAPRFEYARQALDAWLEYHPNLNILLTDDGSPDVMAMMLYAQSRGVEFISGPHNGIGASLNRALAHIGLNEPWIYTTDDWVLTGALDLELAEWLADMNFDLVRLGPLHPNVECTTQFQQGHGWWLELRVGSNEFVCGTRPFLAAPSLIRKVGPFREGVDAYVLEKDFCYRCETVDVMAAAINIHGPWETIGDDYPVGHLSVA